MLERLAPVRAVVQRSLDPTLADRPPRLERTERVLKTDLDVPAVRVQLLAHPVRDIEGDDADFSFRRIDHPHDHARYGRVLPTSLAKTPTTYLTATRMSN